MRELGIGQGASKCIVIVLACIIIFVCSRQHSVFSISHHESLTTSSQDILKPKVEFLSNCGHLDSVKVDLRKTRKVRSALDRFSNEDDGQFAGRRVLVKSGNVVGKLQIEELVESKTVNDKRRIDKRRNLSSSKLRLTRRNSLTTKILITSDDDDENDKTSKSDKDNEDDDLCIKISTPNKISPRSKSLVTGLSVGSNSNSSTQTTASPKVKDKKIEKTIELAVFIDQALDSKFAGLSGGFVELKKQVLSIMSQVQHLFRYSSLSLTINLKLKLVERLKEFEKNFGELAPATAQGDIDTYLSNFCLWQQQRLAKETHLTWDHAILLSGLDLYKTVVNNGKRENVYPVLGLAWIGGMCKQNYSCTINEATNFESAFVIAHELGHSLGILHDGQKNTCDSSKYIMSDKTGPGKVHWSKCSNDYLKDAIKKKQLNCLDTENSDELVDSLHDLEKLKLPGQVHPLSEQCKLAFGNSFAPFIADKHPYNASCRELWCSDKKIARAAHPALEGSSCAKDSVCREGKCNKIEDTGDNSVANDSNNNNNNNNQRSQMST